uniref:SMC hinge domain-containing protein n=1 Tax=Heterorhabditis bacteriophora TaxID=37862 RepID=A0A1I7WXD0_HETBA
MHSTSDCLAAVWLLYHVVIKNKSAARELVEGGLNSRRTFIPWESCIPRKYENLNSRVKRAQDIAKKHNESVVMALDLIDYDPKLEKAFQLVFEGILICDTITCAKDVVYDSHVKLRTVTVRGDDLKPTGTMSGGAVDRSKSPLLVDLEPYMGYKKELIEKKLLWKNLRVKDLIRFEPLHRLYNEKKDCLERANGRLQTIRENLKNSPMQKLLDEIAIIEQELPECDNILKNSALQMKDLNEKIKQYEERKKNEKAFQVNIV